MGLKEVLGQSERFNTILQLSLLEVFILLSEDIGHILELLLSVIFHQDKNSVGELFIVECFLAVKTFYQVFAEDQAFDVFKHLVDCNRDILSIPFPELLVEEVEQVLGFFFRVTNCLGLAPIPLFGDHSQSPVKLRRIFRYVQSWLSAAFVQLIYPLETSQLLCLSEVVDEVLCEGKVRSELRTYTCRVSPSCSYGKRNRSRLYLSQGGREFPL